MNTDADKEAKEKMMREMCRDSGLDKEAMTVCGMYDICDIFDALIRRGWRKANHIADAGKMVSHE